MEAAEFNDLRPLFAPMLHTVRNVLCPVQEFLNSVFSFLEDTPSFPIQYQKHS